MNSCNIIVPHVLYSIVSSDTRQPNTWFNRLNLKARRFMSDQDISTLQHDSTQIAHLSRVFLRIKSQELRERLIQQAEDYAEQCEQNRDGGSAAGTEKTG